jgi:hypothetical protein
MNKSERFGLVLSPSEKRALLRLAERERISAAAVVRRLIWSAAEHIDVESCEVCPDITPHRVTEDEWVPR